MEMDNLYQEFLKSDGVSIDSRTIKPNQIFFALPGTKNDGSDFAHEALDKGARLVILQNKPLKDHVKFIQVKSVIETLQALASSHRDHLTIPVIGITGSVGKTTTKELIATVLGAQFNAFFTLGNLNNHIGVPISILSIQPEHQIAIIEMGANHIGEIADLCAIAKPTFGLITRIGKAHIEGFGSLEGVIIAKSDLYRYIRDHHGTVFIDVQDPMIFNVSKGFDMEKINIHQAFQYKLISAQPNIILDLKDESEWIRLTTLIPGDYNLSNILMALAVGKYFTIPLQKMTDALSRYENKSNRSQLISLGTNQILLDAYNANPTSMMAAIESFAAWNTAGNQKIVMLGDMKEMGTEALAEHQKIHDLLLQKTFDQVCLIGTTFSQTKSLNDRFMYFENVDALRAWYQQQSFQHSYILIKASRGMTLEKVLT